MTVNSARRRIYDLLLTLLILSSAFGIGFLLKDVLDISEHVSTLFAFAVLLVSLFTDGFLFGVLSALASVVIINYAFTYPYFNMDFTVPENIFSAIVMLIIALLTSTFTTRLKSWQRLKVEHEGERMRANLLRAVSHDLRTPLTTIYGASSSILDNYDRLDDGQKMRMIEGVKQDSEWLIRMVENLLSVTKIDAGRVKLIKTETPLDELVDSVILKLKRRYPTQSVELHLPEELLLIPMDAILIEQVLINILENAVHHASGLTRLSLRVYTERSEAVFEIFDDGCGIDAGRLEGIFSGASLGKGEGDSHGRNLGIGLSVCSTIIRAHSGTISAENRDEGGALFRFSIPLSEDTNEQQ